MGFYESHHHEPGLGMDDFRRQADGKGCPAGADFTIAKNMMAREVFADTRDIFAFSVRHDEARIAQASLERLQCDGSAPQSETAHALFGGRLHARPRFAFMRLAQAVISRSATIPMKAMAR